MEISKIVQDLFYNNAYNSLDSLLDRINCIFKENVKTTDLSEDLVDDDYYSELKAITNDSDVFRLLLGSSLKNVKCVLIDECSREHSIAVNYLGRNRLIISDVSLPQSAYQDRVYSSLIEIIQAFKCHIGSLSNYFIALERVDRFCSIVDPVKPSYKDDYRKIILDDRVWLHIEITPEGTASNVHMVGHNEILRDKLQERLTSWDHDKDIVENVMDMFDIVNFPSNSQALGVSQPNKERVDENLCGICLAYEVSEKRIVPQPLCPNPKCGVYYHKECLYQWLVSCAGGRQPPLGMASGACPSCFQQISCSLNDI